MKLRFAATTNAGNRSGANEDHIGWSEETGLWVVADGMGGHAAGEVASEITVQSTLRWAADFRLADSLLKAHEAVAAAARDDERLQGMGSTVVAFRRREDGAEIGWVGDSRAYRLRGRELTQLTRDHSLTQALTDTLGKDASIRDSRILLQAVGMEHPQPEVIFQQVQVGDIFLLASDGLTTEVTDEEIARTLKAAGNPQAAVDALLKAALDHGGGDNVSIIVIEAWGPWFERAGARLGVLAGVAAVAVAALLWLLL
jgi:PPM family protein phosphatase